MTGTAEKPETTAERRRNALAGGAPEKGRERFCRYGCVRVRFCTPVVLALGLVFFFLSGSASGEVDSFAAALRTALLERKTFFRHEGGGAAFDRRSVEAVREQVLREVPEFDYLVERWTFRIVRGGGKSAVEVRIDYWESPEQRAFVVRRVGEILAEIVTPEMDDYGRIAAVHDFIVATVDYDRTLQHFTAYDALRGKAVCHGYALLAFEMYRALGYEVRIISGGDHAWNLIRVCGNWYHVDTTFDDPTYDFQGHFTPEEKRRIAGEIRRDHLLQDDETMRRSGHVWDRNAFPPAPVSFPGP